MNNVKRIAYYAVCTLEAMMIAFVSIIAVINIVMFFQYHVLHATVPTFFGYSYVNILSGSMEPTLSIGDMAICKEQDEYAVGDAVLFQDKGYLVLHRIAEVNDDGTFVMRGDANNVNDETAIPQSSVYGKMVYSFNGMGNTISYISTLAGAFWTVLSALLIYLALDFSKDLLRPSAAQDGEYETDSQPVEEISAETAIDYEEAQEKEDNHEEEAQEKENAPEKTSEGE